MGEEFVCEGLDISDLLGGEVCVSVKKDLV
jgi:hypothetical protein